MDTVYYRKVIEGKEILFILCQALYRFGELLRKYIHKVVICIKGVFLVAAIYISWIILFALAWMPLGILSRIPAVLCHPAVLSSDGGKYFRKGCPESQGSVSHCQFWGRG